MGDRALLIDAGVWAPEALARALRAAATRTAALVLEDVVAGAATVLAVASRPEGLAALGAVVEMLAGRAPDTESVSADGSAEVLELTVRYDGADLDEVARATGLSTTEVAATHAGATYQAAFCGFAPGFAYLTGLPEALWLPRRESPRPSVPAGAVAIADRYSSVYPSCSPGGWHLLGSTDVPVWDLGRRPPALLAPGTQVRFVAAAPGAGRRRPGAERTAQHVATPDRPARRGETAFEVIEPGLCTTVQDRGRPGLADQGVPPSGWLDGPSARLANRLVGNDDQSAVLEATVRGPSLRLDGPPGTSRAIAVTGADVHLLIDGIPAATNAPVEVRAGAMVEVGWIQSGARSYLAVAGGIDVPPVLGSRSTDALSGLGPAPLEAGRRVPLGVDRGLRSSLGLAPVPARLSEPTLRVVPGPRADWLVPEALSVLTAAAWTIGRDSNRVGLRLVGSLLERGCDGELAPEGLVAGAVQVPSSGEPVLFLADHPVTGGYPVLAVVVSADLHLAAQLRPGSVLHFALAGSAGRRRGSAR